MKQKKCANCIILGLGFNNIFKKRLTNILISAVNYPWELEREYDKAVWAADIRWKSSEKDIFLIEHILTEQGELKPASVSLIICGHQKDYVTSFVLSFHEAYNEMTLYFYFFRETLVQKWWMVVIESVCVN